jgi:hypothetical protein
LNICPWALAGKCDRYDGWEPEKICLNGKYAGCRVYAFYRVQDAEVPLNCPGYEYVDAEFKEAA